MVSFMHRRVAAPALGHQAGASAHFENRVCRSISAASRDGVAYASKEREEGPIKGGADMPGALVAGLTKKERARVAKQMDRLVRALERNTKFVEKMARNMDSMAKKMDSMAKTMGAN
jgi:hypothetical protein